MRRQVGVAGAGQILLQLGRAGGGAGPAQRRLAECLAAQGDALLLRAGVGWKDGYVGRATVGAGLNSQAGYTLLSSEPVVVEDLSAETRFNGPPLLHEHEVVSGMSVIINDHHRPFGVLGAHTTKRRRFTRDDVNFLQAVANVLAEAIQRRQAEEEHVRFIHEQAARAEAEEARRRMAFLAEASNLLTASLDYRATLTADRARIRLFNEACLRRGLVKAVNKIYVSLAHTDADVEQALDIFDGALADVARSPHV